MYLRTTLLWAVLTVLLLAGCTKWDAHNNVENQDLTKTLLDEISQRSTLSRFYGYVKSTGLDKELAASKSHTVWAPTNDALQSLDPAIVSDTARLRQFVANHISYQTYFTRNAQTPRSCAVLNGKRVTFSATNLTVLRSPKRTNISATVFCR